MLYAGKTLPGQRRQTALEDPQIIIGLQFHMRKMELEIAALGAANQQQAKADKLTDDGGPSSAGDPQIQHKDQQRIQSDVQHRAAGDAHHGVSGLPGFTPVYIGIIVFGSIAKKPAPALVFP